MSSEKIRSQFLDVIEIEKDAMDLYGNIHTGIKDRELITIIEPIMKEKENHLNLINRALSILDSLDAPIKKRPDSPGRRR